MDKFAQRVQTLSVKATQIQTLRDHIASDLSAKEQEVTDLQVLVDKLLKVSAVLRSLMDSLVTERVRPIETIVTEGLKTVFSDVNLSFEASIGESRGRITLDFLIRQGNDKFSIVGDPLTSYGGGPSTLASLILRFLIIYRKKLYPLLVLDEQLAAISAEYIDATSSFIQKLAAKTAICVLLVTHNPAFLERADHAFEGVSSTTPDDRWSFKLRKIRSHDYADRKADTE